MDNIIVDDINVFASPSLALQALQEEVVRLQAIVDALEEKIAVLEAHQIDERDWKLVEWRLDKQSEKIDRLEHPHTKTPTPTHENRIKILRSLLAAHNGKMSAKEAREIMKMEKAAFSRLVAAMPEYIKTKTSNLDKRQTILILRSQMVVDNDQPI